MASTSCSETKPSEQTEHDHHSQEVQTLLKSWPHPRPRCSRNKFSASCVKIHFVRHGEGQHNLLAKQRGGCTCNTDPLKCPYKDEKVMDARLTELGRDQARTNQPFTETLTNLSLIYVSPLSRAVETALLAFNSHNQNNLCPFVANENLREQNGKHICDRRRSVDEIKLDYPTVDFNGLKTNEDVLWTEERETKMNVALRAKEFFEYLTLTVDEKSRSVTELGVVCHSAFLLTVFNVALDCGKEEDLEKWFSTGELRTVWVEL